jgi:tetratricopeptide (TPR) repeat protein
MILYELLTGKAPFKRKNHAASIAAVINESVPMPSGVNPQVDQDLEAICLKALQKEPTSRYESAHDLRRDLLRWLDGRAVSVRKLSQPETFRRWLTRNPLVASAVAFGMASLAIGLLFSASQWNQAQTNLQQSNLQRVRAEKNVEQLHGTLVKALEISLDSLEKDPNVSPSQQQVLDELMLAHKQLIDEEAEQVEITAETFDCYERLARIYRNTARYEEAYEICDQAEKMVDRCFATEAGRKKFGMCATEVFLQRGLVADDASDRNVQQSSYGRSIELLLESEPHADRLAWLEKGFRVYRNWGFANFSRDND